MTKPVISVRGLGKKYKLGATISHNTLRDHIAHGVKSFWNNIRGNESFNAISSSYNAEQTATLNNLSPSQNNQTFWALKDVNFDVQQGEVLGIIGRNGSGKTTLLKILSQITEPTEGEVRIRGHVSSLLEVGTGFHPELQGCENIFLNGAILGMTKSEINRRFDEIVAFAEIEKFLDTPVKRYSSGMYVRLAFAVAAHLEPEILLVDEVLAVGDTQFQKKCLWKMNEVANEGRTVLFVSHNMGAVQQLTNTCLLLRDGNVHFKGDVAQGVAEYLKIDNFEEIFNNKNIKTNVEGFQIISFVFNKKKMKHGFNCPLYFEIELLLKKEFFKVSFGFGLVNSIGARILTFEKTIDHLQKGHLLIEFILKEHHLPPGNYSVTIGFLRGTSTIIYKENIISFDILEKEVDNIYLVQKRDKIGAFYQPEHSITTL